MGEQKSTITVEIDPNTELPARYLGSDEDGPQYGPMSLYDCIIKAAVDRLVGYGEKAVKALVNETLQDRIMAAVDERLPGIIEAAFAEKVEVGDGWSSQQKSVRELIGDRVRDQVKIDQHGFNRTVMGEVFRSEVDRSLSEELKAEVQAAKAELRETLQRKARELLATETLWEAGIR